MRIDTPLIEIRYHKGPMYYIALSWNILWLIIMVLLMCVNPILGVVMLIPIGGIVYIISTSIKNIDIKIFKERIEIDKKSYNIEDIEFRHMRKHYKLPYLGYFYKGNTKITQFVISTFMCPNLTRIDPAKLLAVMNSLKSGNFDHIDTDFDSYNSDRNLDQFVSAIIILSFVVPIIMLIVLDKLSSK